MKLPLRAVVLFLLALALLAPAAHADNNIRFLNGHYENATTGQITDADGNALVLDATPAWTVLRASAISQRFVYGADGLSTGWVASGNQPKVVTVDSTTVIDTRGYKNVALLFNFQFEDSVYASLWALQVNVHQNVGIDSTSKYPILGHFDASSAAVDDTLGRALEYGAYEMPAPGSTGSLIPFGNGGKDTSMYARGEHPMFIKVTRSTSQNASVLLTAENGQSMAAGFITVRLRLQGTFNDAMAAYGSNGTAYGSPPVAGAPATGMCEKCGGQPTANPIAWGRWIIVRMDVVGWN